MEARTMGTQWDRLIELLEPFHGQAAATARRLCRSAADGDDLYQETLLRAFEKLHTLKDPARFRSWFYAILLSVHRSRSRRSFWRRFLPIEECFPDGAGPVGEDGAHWPEEAWRANRMVHALAGLPAVQREAVVLFEIEEFSIEEIAEIQDSSVPAVKSRLARGRERLRRHYERLGWSDAAVPRAEMARPPRLAEQEVTHD